MEYSAEERARIIAESRATVERLKSLKPHSPPVETRNERWKREAEDAERERVKAKEESLEIRIRRELRQMRSGITTEIAAAIANEHEFMAEIMAHVVADLETKIREMIENKNIPVSQGEVLPPEPRPLVRRVR